MFRIIDKKLCSHLSSSKSIITAHLTARRELPSLKPPDSTPRTCKLCMQFANQKCHQFVEVSWCEVLWKNEREKKRSVIDWGKLPPGNISDHCGFTFVDDLCFREKRVKIFQTMWIFSRLLLRNSSLVTKIQQTKSGEKLLTKNFS